MYFLVMEYSLASTKFFFTTYLQALFRTFPFLLLITSKDKVILPQNPLPDPINIMHGIVIFRFVQFDFSKGLHVFFPNLNLVQPGAFSQGCSQPC